MQTARVRTVGAALTQHSSYGGRFVVDLVVAKSSGRESVWVCVCVCGNPGSRDCVLTITLNPLFPHRCNHQFEQPKENCVAFFGTVYMYIVVYGTNPESKLFLCYSYSSCVPCYLDDG